MENTAGQIRNIVVLGGGTAGLLAAIALKRHLPQIDLTLVRSTDMGVIGVGEGTIPSVVHFLERFLGIDPWTMYSQVRASPKLGIRYLWGKRPLFHYTFSGQLSVAHPGLRLRKGYYCNDEFDFADLNSALMFADRVCLRMPGGQPKYDPNTSLHLENKRFVGFLESISDQLGIHKIDDLVDGVVTDTEGVGELILSGGSSVKADFFVDCSGFRAELIQRTLREEVIDFSDALYCDRAVIGGWQRSTETYHPFTTAETMNAGWCWQIEHDDIINRGYVFCSQFISDDQAVAEFRATNPRASDPRVIGFRSFVHRRSWVKNVVALGNAAGFVEPLEATAIGMICDGVLRMVKALQASDGFNLPLQREIFNRTTLTNWQIIRDFLALHYKFNDRIDSPFWTAARNDVDLGDAQEFVDYYRDVGPDFSLLASELKRNFFAAEGYLVMLLGQQVAYSQQRLISETDRQQWNQFKKRLGVVAGQAFDVPQFLKIARSAGAGHLISKATNSGKFDNQASRVGENLNEGLLGWQS